MKYNNFMKTFDASVLASAISYPDYLEFLNSGDKKEYLLITRHEMCFTLGKNSRDEEILSTKQVNSVDIPIYRSNRGGGATYHDQGQLVFYPSINLKIHNLSISDYIFLLEQIGIEAFKECGIEAKRGVQPGLWADNAKIAFIGLALKNGYTQHGIAFNLADCAVKNFSKIIACNSFEKIYKAGISLLEFQQAMLMSIKQFELLKDLDITSF